MICLSVLFAKWLDGIHKLPLKVHPITGGMVCLYQLLSAGSISLCRAIPCWC